MEPNASDAASEPRGALPAERESGSSDPTGEEADGALVERTLAGERAAFDILVRRYQRQAVAVSYRLLGSSHDALEVTQDAFLKAFTSLSTLQTPAAFGGWLMRIVSNLSLNFRRGRKTRWQLPLDEVLGPIEGGSAKVSSMGESANRGDDPLRRLESLELGQKLKDALAKLPEKQRLALIMFTIEEMPQKQVAEALQCSVEAVKWHVFQGRKKLKGLLGDVL
jgi:RNA polymerase sigma-70 factor (ECF subfamily)